MRIASLRCLSMAASLLVATVVAWGAGSQVTSHGMNVPNDPYDPIDYNFETGMLQGWAVQSGSFGRLVSNRSTFYSRPSIPYNKQGAYFLSTEQTPSGRQSDAYSGVVVSPRFTLTRPTISFLIGGGAGPGVYVGVYTVRGRMVYRARADNAEVMHRVAVNLRPYVGQTLYLKVVDHETGPWGHITFDDFRANIVAAPAHLAATRDTGGVTLTWNADPEAGVAGYTVYRSTSLGGPYTGLTARPLHIPRYRDTALRSNVTYYYQIATVGTDAVESERATTMARPYADLYARGSIRTYRGTYLTAIRFPVGGIAAGSIVENGQAERSLWWIFNNVGVKKGTGVVPNSFFAVRVQRPGHSAVVRALQTVSVGPFQGMRSLSFQGEYPLGWYTFADPTVPVKISMETYSPFIPMDLKNSSIPVAIYNLTARNTTRNRLRVDFLASQQNAVGFNGYDAIGGPNKNRVNGYGHNRNRVLPGKTGTMLSMLGPIGSMELAAYARHVTGTARWTSLQALRGEFAATGSLSGPTTARSPAKGVTVDGALATAVVLRPGETRTIPFVLTWYFPHARHGYAHWGGAGNQYTNWWSSAADVARYVAARFTFLQTTTRLYHDSLYASNFPRYILDRISAATAVLRTPTVFWTKTGYFGGWEGTNVDASYHCCPGNVTHVYQYAQTPARLFPSLGRQLREEDFSDQEPNGLIPFRYGNGAYAADGQLGVILGSYREYLLSTNGAWLHANWPHIKRAMEYIIQTNDPSHNGMLTGYSPTTLDTSLSGTSSWIGTLYLAALEASSRMAALVGDRAASSLYQTIFRHGQARQNAALWTGAYYAEKSQHLPHDVEYGDGMAIDMLLGQWWASQLDLGEIYPAARTKTALQSLFTDNYRDNFLMYEPDTRFTPEWRRFVRNTDAGTLMFSWPHHDKPANPRTVWYNDETWTGTEYAAAATMIQQGLLTDGLRMIKAVADRYDGQLRASLDMALGNCGVGYGTGNPFGDDECGKWYARSMSSWSILLALQGFIYDGPARTLGFKPVWQPDDHRSFFTISSGWGVFTQRRTVSTQDEQLTLTYGSLNVRTLIFRLAHGTGTAHIGVRVAVNGTSMAGSHVSTHDGDLIIVLPHMVALRAGARVTVHTDRAP